MLHMISINHSIDEGWGVTDTTELLTSEQGEVLLFTSYSKAEVAALQWVDQWVEGHANEVVVKLNQSDCYLSVDDGTETINISIHNTVWD